MTLLVRRVEWQFQRNLRRQILASELGIKIQRMKECFLGDSLPLPTAKVIAAWNDMPNDTTEILPLSMKTELVFLRAPPPTPMGFAFDTDDAPPDNSSLNDSRDDGWMRVDDTELPRLDVVGVWDLEGPIASEENSTPRYTYPDRSLDRQINEVGSSQSTESNSKSPSSSSDRESLSSSSRTSSALVGFDDMVNQWLLDYRARGSEQFIESLIEFGVVSLETAPLASRIARAVIRKVATISYMEGKNQESAIRLSTLAAFKGYWGPNDTWKEASSTPTANTISPTPYGINIASFMGSLFNVGLSNARDVHLCLSILSEGEKCFDRLYAMHALLTQANDKLCKNRNFPALMEFKDTITSKNTESGKYLWDTNPRSKSIIVDILATIERWLVSQAIRRDHYRVSPAYRAVRQRAVGPRLRNGPGV